MKTTTTALILLLSLVGCGGGGGSSNATTTATTTTSSIKMCVPATFTASTFTCATECNASTEYAQNFFNDTATCQTAGTQWIAEYTRNDTPATAEQLTAYNYIDAVRQNVGVAPLKYDSRLEEASRLHELYVEDIYTTYNTFDFHYEDNVTYPSQYYRGKYGYNRANAQGFLYSAIVGEVVTAQWSSGVVSNEYNTTKSIEWLLTAIYHRQAMLDNRLYRVGNGGFDTAFATMKVQAHLFASENDKTYFLKELSTDIGVYPYDGQTNVQTTFDNRETPDPLPNTTAPVGNPISVQLNDMKVVSPTMVSFKLFYDANSTEITDTTTLDKFTDPNGRFTAYEFALFANAPLLANTRYRAEFEYVDGGINKTKVWRFTTEL